MKIGCIALVQRHIYTEHIKYSQFVAIECAKGRGLILPGGKWEQGKETYREAAIRELYEETTLQASSAKYIFGSPDESGYYCHTFRCFVDDEQLALKVGTSTPEGTSCWATPQELINQTKVFKGYYEMLFDVFNFF